MCSAGSEGVAEKKSKHFRTFHLIAVGCMVRKVYQPTRTLEITFWFGRKMCGIDTLSTSLNIAGQLL